MAEGKVTFDHVHLISKDPAAAARWYVGMLGGTIIREAEMRGAPHIEVDISGVRILIRGKRSAEQPRNNNPLQHFEGFVSHEQWDADHFGFKVSGDFLDYCASIKEKGAVFVVEPFAFVPGVHIAFISGPDGETIELVESKPQ